MSNIAIILLAGSGNRFSEHELKQFVNLNGHPLAYYSIKSFQDSRFIQSIILVTKKECIDSLNNIVNENNFNKVKCITIGGITRQESVFNGLKVAKFFAKENDNVFIHDGARPFLDNNVLLNMINSLTSEQAVIPVLSIKDTLIVSNDNSYQQEVVDRKLYYRVQTPQAFKFKTIYKAHKVTNEHNISDDAQLVKNQGIKVKIIPGSEIMMKLTTPNDFLVLKSLAKGNNHEQD